MKESVVFVLLPGGFGTMDEGFELLTLIQTGKMMSVPIVFLDEENGDYWKNWEEFIKKDLLGDNYISKEDLSLFKVTDSVDTAVSEITNFLQQLPFTKICFWNSRIAHAKKISDKTLEALNKEFADIIVEGNIEKCESK
jgi:predicted Rossmann-fold nucleotide-binding protein